MGAKKEIRAWSSDTLLESIQNALRGIYHILTNHRNARLIFLSAIFAMVCGFYLGISKLEIFVLSVAIMVVFLAEVINTLIEDLSNLITEEFHPKIKLIKDVAAGVVLVAVLFAGILGFFVFLNRVILLWQQL